jgi:hypothetical protein
MNSTKTSPTGIDVAIQKIQQYLYNNLTWSDLDGYGRCYKQASGEYLVPMVYNGDGDYKIATYDDKRNKYFFLASDNRVNNNQFLTGIGIIFLLDLDVCYPTVSHRADEESHDEVVNLLEKYSGFRNGGELITGQENVFAEFQLPETSIFDVHPRHCFRINFEIPYNYNFCD